MFKRIAKKPVASTRARLGLERLEERETPAIVTVTLTNGSMTLTSDGGSEVISVFEVGVGRFDVVGGGSTQVRLGKAGTPMVSLHDLAVTGNITATFGSGDDNFDMRQNLLTLLGDITINMGAGSDSVVLEKIQGRNLTVNQANPAAGALDNDYVEIRGCALRGSATLNNFVGADYVTIDGFLNADDSFVDAGVAGSLNINNRLGSDYVEIDDARIGGGLTINNTAGTGFGNFVEVDDSYIGRNLRIASPGNVLSEIRIEESYIGGAVSVTSGSPSLGFTRIEVDESFIGLSATITGGSGNDSINIEGSYGTTLMVDAGNGTNDMTFAEVRTGGSATVKGGSGNDVIRSTFNLDIGGNAIFNLGNGTNRLELGYGQPDDRVLVGGNLNVTGGTGQDTLVFWPVLIHGTTAVNLGAGNDELGMNSGRNYFGGTATFNFGAGDDALSINEGTFLGNLTIVLGAGADKLFIGNADQPFDFVSVSGAFSHDVVLGETSVIRKFRRAGFPTIG